MSITRTAEQNNGVATIACDFCHKEKQAVAVGLKHICDECIKDLLNALQPVADKIAAERQAVAAPTT